MGVRSQLVQAMKTMVERAQATAAMVAAQAASRAEMAATSHQLALATTAAQVPETEAPVAPEEEVVASTSQKWSDCGFLAKRALRPKVAPSTITADRAALRLKALRLSESF